MAMTDSQTRPDEQWRAMSERLRRLALGLAGGSEADADDLVQQAIANLLARSPDKALDPAYARRALVNAWLDRQRSLRRRVARLAVRARTQRAWHVDADAVSDEEVRSRVRAIVTSLPPRQRAVLTMRTVEGMSDEAIASSLGCSREAVRASLHLARRAVRARLGDAT